MGRKSLKMIEYTVELQMAWNHVKMFEIWLIRANEC